jgi:hypothetical protein
LSMRPKIDRRGKSRSHYSNGGRLPATSENQAVNRLAA